MHTNGVRITYIFSDVDGTIAQNDRYLAKLGQAVRHLGERGIKRCVATGRSHISMERIEKLSGFGYMSEEAFQVLQGGARIMRKGEKKNIKYFPLKYEEIKEAIGLIKSNSEEIMSVRYYPMDLDKCPFAWVKSEDGANDLIMYYGKDNIVITEDLDEFENQAMNDKAGLISIIPKDDFKFTFPQGINAVVNGNLCDVTSEGVTKGNAVLWVAEESGILPENILVAGDHRNDASMLGVETFGRRIFVGSQAEAADYGIPDSVERVDIPEQFVEILFTL